LHQNLMRNMGMTREVLFHGLSIDYDIMAKVYMFFSLFFLYSSFFFLCAHHDYFPLSLYLSFSF
jgi:hypothetical protein